MPSPTFPTKRQWFHWYSAVYLKCPHWRHTVRPAVFKYRKGICSGCGKRITTNYWHCHHGRGMYAHLGEEQKYLSRMDIYHPKCHHKKTRKDRLKRLVRAFF